MSRKLLVVLLFIVVAGFILRIYNLDKNFIFTADEEYQTTYAATLVSDPHPIWIGVSQSDTGFYLGPYWTYLTAILLGIGNGSPLVTGYFSAVLGTVSILLIFVIGDRLFGKNVGLVGAFLYAVSPLMVYFDQRYWNPSSLPLLSILLFFTAAMIVKNQWWLAAWTFLFGLSLHAHLSLVPLILVPLINLILSKQIPKRRVLLASALSFMVAIWPLVVFDFNHNFSNAKTPIRMIEHALSQANTGTNPWSSAVALGTSLGRSVYLAPGRSNIDEVLWACREYQTANLPTQIVVLLLIGMFLANKHTWMQDSTRTLGISTLVLAISFVFYPAKAHEYYLLGLFPLVFLMISTVFVNSSSKTRWLAWGLVGVFAVSSIYTISRNDTQFGLNTKVALINKATAELNESYYLDEQGDCHKWEGWRYLFTHYGKRPSSSSTDSSLGWLYPNEIESRTPALKVIMYETRNDGGYKYEIAPNN